MTNPIVNARYYKAERVHHPYKRNIRSRSTDTIKNNIIGREVVDNKNLFVENIDSAVTQAELKEAFAQYGAVKNAIIAVKGNTRMDYGFVSFDDPMIAYKAMEAMNGKQLGSKIILVRFHSIGETLYYYKVKMTNSKHEYISTEKTAHFDTWEKCYMALIDYIAPKKGEETLLISDACIIDNQEKLIFNRDQIQQLYKNYAKEVPQLTAKQMQFIIDNNGIHLFPNKFVSNKIVSNNDEKLLQNTNVLEKLYPSSGYNINYSPQRYKQNYYNNSRSRSFDPTRDLYRRACNPDETWKKISYNKRREAYT